VETAIAYDLFLSYSRRDLAAAETLAARLVHETGLRLWMDRARQERDLAYTLRDARPGFRVVYALLPGAPPPQGTRFLEEMRQRKEGGDRRPGGPR